VHKSPAHPSFFYYLSTKQIHSLSTALNPNPNSVAMKLTSSTVAACLVGLAFGAEFVSVDLEAPLNWVAGTYLFPVEIIAGYNGIVEGSNYTAETWGAYVLSECETYTACTSAISYQGMENDMF
jgi:hypothetical protein